MARSTSSHDVFGKLRASAAAAATTSFSSKSAPPDSASCSNFRFRFGEVRLIALPLGDDRFEQQHDVAADSCTPRRPQVPSAAVTRGAAGGGGAFAHGDAPSILLLGMLLANLHPRGLATPYCVELHSITGQLANLANVPTSF
jgi:hypothetical protein